MSREEKIDLLKKITAGNVKKSDLVPLHSYDLVDADKGVYLDTETGKEISYKKVRVIVDAYPDRFIEIQAITAPLEVDDSDALPLNIVALDGIEFGATIRKNGNRYIIGKEAIVVLPDNNRD